MLKYFTQKLLYYLKFILALQWLLFYFINKHIKYIKFQYLSLQKLWEIEKEVLLKLYAFQTWKIFLHIFQWTIFQALLTHFLAKLTLKMFNKSFIFIHLHTIIYIYMNIHNSNTSNFNILQWRRFNIIIQLDIDRSSEIVSISYDTDSQFRRKAKR